MPALTVRSRARRGSLAVLALAALLTGAACDDLDAATGAAPGGPTNAGGPPVTVKPADSAAATKQLATIPVAAPKEGGYNRTKYFGPAWSYDYDRNGCRQRDDVLRRDLTQVKLSNRCTVTSGVLADPYTGKTIKFTKSNADAVQIDHIYPLSAAWAHGARAWAQQTRVRFANDPANLLAVDGPTNNSKSDDTAAEWQPRPAARCMYAVRYVKVAATYRLSISAADKKALTTMLGTCPKK